MARPGAAFQLKDSELIERLAEYAPATEMGFNGRRGTVTVLAYVRRDLAATAVAGAPSIEVR